MLCQSLLYSLCVQSLTGFYTYMHSFFIPSVCIYFPMLYSTTLFIHSKCNNLHLLAPNSQSIPLLSHFPLGNHKSDLGITQFFIKRQFPLILCTSQISIMSQKVFWNCSNPFSVLDDNGYRQ